MEKLEQGSTAPDFSLFDQNGDNYVLSDERGQWAVLFFCPELSAPYTISLSIGFRNMVGEYEAHSIRVYGVYNATIDELKTFASDHTLPFALLADEKGTTSARYGVNRSGGIFGDSEFHPHVFVVNPEGKIVKVYTEIDPVHQGSAVLKDVIDLQQKGRE